MGQFSETLKTRIRKIYYFFFEIVFQYFITEFDGNQVTFRGCEEVENVVIGCKSVTISNIVEAHKCYCNSHNCNSADAPRIYIIVPFLTVFVFLLAK